MNNDVYIRQTKIFNYDNNSYFNPSEMYPEGLNISIKSDYRIYNEVRNLLIDMKLDKSNIGKKEWNPFKDFIKRNNNVVIKPNLVRHINDNIIDGNTDSLITNFSVIRPIIDYTLLALQKTGSLIIGDAPVQECIFEEVIKIGNLKEAISIYKKEGYNIELKDFRKNKQNIFQSTLINLGQDSEFVEVDKYHKKYAITNYNLKYMHEHHNETKHEYLISNYILKADVIINLPKPKTHRKAGMTACLKNFIGANVKKEFIPHHRNGNTCFGGDEYPEKSFIKMLFSYTDNYSYLHNKFLMIIKGLLRRVLRILKKERFLEGSWYGNDTIWRSIIDINKIVSYADKNGIMKKDKQRIIFNVADMIISGEKEGPLIPSNKEVGLLVASFNCLNMDKSICKIMGFESEKIKYIINGYKLKKYLLSDTRKYNNYLSNKKVNLNILNKHFIASDGWRDYLNK